MTAKQLAALILPITFLAVVPAILLFNFSTGKFEIGFSSLYYLGILFVLVGLWILAMTIRALHGIGEGTIAPWDPTEKLVTSGLYAYTRNPMIGGALLVLLGEAIIFGSAYIFIWLFLFFIINSLYFRFIEEPSLEKRFGEQYREYKKNVPTWVPRKEPWEKK